MAASSRATGGKAIYLKTGGSNVTCRDCWMRDCRRGIYCESIHHLTLHGLQTRSLPGGQQQAEQVYLGHDCREVRVVNNHFAYGAERGHHPRRARPSTSFSATPSRASASASWPKPDKTGNEADCRDITIGSNYFNGGCAIRLEGRCNGFVISNNNFVAARPRAPSSYAMPKARAPTASRGNVIRKSAYKEQGGINLGDSEGCTVIGNVFEKVLATPAISAGPGGGKHIITANNINKSSAGAIVVKDAADCLLSGNLIDGKPLQ